MKIYFADLTHTGHTCNSVPYGIALVAANAIAEIGEEISVRLVKKPTDLASLFEDCEPGMICFSMFVWNAEVSLSFALRIKKKYPKCIIVFGGPHYPVDVTSQQSFLEKHPEVDFFVYREGENAFVQLYKALKDFDFNVEALKTHGNHLPGCHYCQDGVLIAGVPLQRIDSLDQLPSPYVSGLCDQFLEEGHAAVIQTVRGCPFGCTYCQEGDAYFNATKHYSNARIKSDLEYIGSLAKSSTLFLADSNFGMYSEDINSALALATVQKEHGWPEFVVSISGKNNKERVLKTVATIKGGMFSAAIQSSDIVVLDNIKRRNVSLKELIESATELDLDKTHSFSEIIVALPGDTLVAHCKSAADLIDAGIHVVRSHQLIMLPGAEVASAVSRKKFGLQTRFRVIHNTVNTYSIFGQSFCAPEVDEICVSNNTMSFQDYLGCRCFDLTVEIFYNNGVFSELHAFLKYLDITISSFIMQLNACVWAVPALANLYSGFLKDTQELWGTREELTVFLQQPGVLERYANGELGRNEQLAYKAVALFEKMDELIALAYGVATDLLRSSGHLSPRAVDYLDQLMRFDLLRKNDLLMIHEERSGLFHYDFLGLGKLGLNKIPWAYRASGETQFLFSHTDKHKQFIAETESLLKSGLHGYATVIAKNPKICEYFRAVSTIESVL